jgi:hypothetical protein
MPDFFVEETDAWLVLPHELVELNPQEVEAFRPHAFALAASLRQ